MSQLDPWPTDLLTPQRKITGMSAILVPFRSSGEIDWEGFRNHLSRTVDAGLTPAVNMDTGYVNLLSADDRQQVLQVTAETIPGVEFVAGAYVADHPGAGFDLVAYQHDFATIQQAGGLPIVFQSYGLTSGDGPEILQRYHALAESCDRFLAFELGQMFAPFGAIYDLETYAGLMSIPNCIGAKHSSLRRQLEWERLRLRNQQRPDFMVLTGNDLAIDMVMYGSDYLLGLSTFAPDQFALRDSYWLAGDPRFFELNDSLQYLGDFAFRAPTAGYKHTAAMFLKARGWIGTDRTHPDSVNRPDSDPEILRQIAIRLDLPEACTS